MLNPCEMDGKCHKLIDYVQTNILFNENCKSKLKFIQNLEKKPTYYIGSIFVTANQIDDYFINHNDLKVKLLNVIQTRSSFITIYVYFDNKCMTKLFRKDNTDR